MSSTRLPGKVLASVAGKPMLELMIERVRRVPSLDEIIIATTINRTDDPIVELAERLGVTCWRGSEEDVLLRVLEAAQAHQVDVIVELTGDCPLIDPVIIEQTVQKYLELDLDYVSNILYRTFPIGMDTEIFSRAVLEDVARRTIDPIDHEHVSCYIYQHPETYTLGNVSATPECAMPHLRLTLDTPEDLDVIRNIFEALYPIKQNFNLTDVLKYLEDNAHIAEINKHIQHRYV